MGVGVEAICPSIRQIASFRCTSLAMTVGTGVSLAMTVKRGNDGKDGCSVRNEVTNPQTNPSIQD